MCPWRCENPNAICRHCGWEGVYKKWKFPEIILSVKCPWCGRSKTIQYFDMNYVSNPRLYKAIRFARLMHSTMPKELEIG